MARRVLVVVFSLVAVSARAQSPYVAGTIGADLTRVSHTESNFGGSSPDGSEVWSGSLRVGTSVGPNWGVELEFVRSGESHDSQGLIGLPILADGFTPVSVTAVLNRGTSLAGIAIPSGFTTDVRQSHADFDGTAWVRQRLGDSVDLVYVGGVAFSRRRTEVSQRFPTVLPAALAIFAPVPGGV